MPATSPTITVTWSTRIAPFSAITAPRITNGTVLATRCPKPLCRNGLKTIPSRPPMLRGTIPNSSSR